MTDVGLMLKAMRLAWIPRLLKYANSNWNSEPNFFLRTLGGLNFLLRCNYDVTPSIKTCYPFSMILKISIIIIWPAK